MFPCFFLLWGSLGDAEEIVKVLLCCKGAYHKSFLKSHPRCIMWTIWHERNIQTFNREVILVDKLKAIFIFIFISNQNFIKKRKGT
jgi:hypothetical protein